MFRIFGRILSKSGVGTKKNLVGTRNPLEPTFWVRTRNPSGPTFWVPTRNQQPTETHFGPIWLEPGTHRNPYFWNQGWFHPEARNSWVPGFRTCRPLALHSKSSTFKIYFFNNVTEASLTQFARDPLFGVSTWNPEPTFWVPTWNPEPTFWVPTWNSEPTGTHFGPICLEPGTDRNPYFWN